MAKRLEIAEALSTRTVNDLSEKEKIIQEQVKLIEEREKEGISDALRDKDKEIMAATESLKRKCYLMQRLQKVWRNQGCYRLEQ